jgi:molybdate transport system substrate-binding protein
MRRLALLGGLVALLSAGVTATSAQEMVLSVAISMKEAVEDVGRQFVAQRPGVTLRYNFGASGELQKQIEAGAPVDVFISAATRQMDELERGGFLLPDSRREFARNVLVAVKPVDEALDLPGPSDLLNRRVQRIAVGNPKTVPAGQYAEESLRALGLWERVRARLVFGENVRQVLDYVSRGEVQVGIVYATDALTRAGRVRLTFPFPEDTHRPIVYPAAVVKGGRHPELARAYLELLTGPVGQSVLRRLGFELPAGGGR